ncbi:MAG: type II secretion system F family protein [Actinobacteria bacterium]|nr:type II secretion system F family protein [Actinomycetota bacterium]
MIIYIIIGTVFLSIFLLILFSGMPIILKKNQKSSISSRLSYYDTNTTKKEVIIPSFFDRMVMPIFSRIGSTTKKIIPTGIRETAKNKLEQAGFQDPRVVDIYLIIKFFLPIGFIFLLILLNIFFTLTLQIKLVLILSIPLSYFLPDIYLRNKIFSRKDEIRRSLPIALDMLTISVEAGMGFDNALLKVSNNTKGPLGQEFEKMLFEMQLGFSRKEAFRNLQKRTDVQDLNSFIVSMVQADIFGIPIGKVLRTQAVEMRIKRRQQAEEKGIKAPVKLVFPLILCLFPALMTVVLGPAAIRIYYILLEGNIFN